MNQRVATPDVVVFHRDGRAARRTIERLSRAGVDGSAIRLVGPTEVVTAGRYADRQTDLGAARALLARFGRGALWGAVPGGAFGAVLLSVFAEPGLINALAGAGGGASVGAGVGALAALLLAPTMVTAWERTFAPLVPGGVLVGVRVASPRQRRRIDVVLRSTDPRDVVEVGDLDDLDDRVDLVGLGRFGDVSTG